ncbi:MAG: response regulator, partial [Gammaproteobacteria bacterium]|nr:response regulator [Gammaproteobacteria bacterium]
ETININQVIAGAEPMLEKLLTAGIRIVTNLDNDLWNIHIDSNDLENALINIGINAKYAMNDKGSLTFVTMNKKLTKEASDKLGLVTGDYVRLSIFDTGCGMDEATRSRIFDPFFSTKGANGTGLGLSQVYGFIQRSDGAVSVESKLEKGTLFNLYFPRMDSEATQKLEHSPEHEKQAVNQQCTVLVVDDEEALARLTVETLNSVGYKAEVAYDAAEALAKMKQKTFDVMISDVIMPGFNGYELAAKVKKAYPATKIIITSGYDESVVVEGEKNELFEQRLEKPVTRTRLLECLNEVLN